MMDCYKIVLFIFINVCSVFSHRSSEFVTQTVYGFLDFTTTIENTVMIFSPQTAPRLDIPNQVNLPINIIETKPIAVAHNKIKPTKIKDKADLGKNRTNDIFDPKNTIKITNNKDFDNTNSVILQLDNDNLQPEYDLLSREPQEFAEETFRIINFKSKIVGDVMDKFVNKTSTFSVVLKASKTEVFPETSKNSHISKTKKLKVRPTISHLHVLKTAEPLFSKTIQGIKPHRSSLNNISKSNSMDNIAISSSISPTIPLQNTRKVKKSRSRVKSKRRKSLHNSQSHGALISSITPTYTTESTNRRFLRTKVHTSTSELNPTNVFKLNRTPGRWQYKSAPKPRVTIRNTVINSTNILHNISTSHQDSIYNPVQNSIFDNEGSEHSQILVNNNENVHESKNKNLEETLNIKISTPANLENVYYEIATIRTPYIFQAGVVKKTRFITITSTLEKLLKSSVALKTSTEEVFPENILSTRRDNILLESSIRTLDVIHLTDDETPALETVTESFSTTLTKLRTQILPVIYDHLNTTKFMTLVQTFDFTSIITATKTIYNIDNNQFIPSQNFKDFSGILDEAGSEFNLEIESNEDDNKENLQDKHFNLKHNHVDQSNNKDVNSSIQILNFDQMKQLELLNLYPNSQLPPNAHQIRRPETIWESHVIPIVNGYSTMYQTFSKPVFLRDNIHYESDSSLLPLPISQPVSLNPFVVPGLQNYQTITSSFAHQTLLTQTNSKILKLTFGAKTAYTTLFSTTVIPTVYTQLFTTSVPLPAAGAYPGYFPPAYHPYAFIG